MRMALSLARRGCGSVSPNPMVGCVIADRERGDAVVSYGYHRRCGEAHAEANALAAAGQEARGKTVYVNLEPCCHTGRTPPCCDALIRAGVGRVVVGSPDPNPVAGGGIERLREAGIDVRAGVLEAECRWLNRGFIRRVSMNRPWVTIKAAISLDGDIALANGASKWISGPASRQRAHLLRAESDAILVGIGTVRQDDPSLTVRDTDGRSPLRAVLDRDLALDPDALVLKGGGCVIFTAQKHDAQKRAKLEDRGAKLIALPPDGEGHIPVGPMLESLAQAGVNRLLVEGGAGVIGSLLSAGFVDDVSLFVAPKLMGNGLHITQNLSFQYMNEVVSMKHAEMKKIGDDVWYEGVLSCSPDL